MVSSVTGIFCIQILNGFAGTADSVQLAKLCQDVGLPAELQEKKRYSILHFNRLIDMGCQRFWPDLTLQQGQYRLGEKAIEVYKKTLAGRVSLQLSGSDAKRLASTTPDFYKAISTSGTVTFVDTGEKSYCLQFRGFESPPHYHYGAFAKFGQMMVPNGKFEMKILKLKNPEPGVYLSDMDFTGELP